MNGELSSEPSSLWRKILTLGEHLQDLSIPVVTGHDDNQGLHAAARDAVATMIAQRNEIVSQTEQILNCRAKLWLAEALLPSLSWLYSGDTNHRDEFSGDALTLLMEEAYRSRQTCCGDTAGSTSMICRDEEYLENPGLCQVVAFPIQSQAGEVLGVLQAERLDENQFTQDAIALLDGIVSQSLLGLQATRRLALEHWRVEQLALVQHVSAQIVNQRDLDDLTRQLTTLIQETFGYYYVAIFTVEPGDDTLNFRASAGGEPQPGSGDLRPAGEPLFIRIGKGMIGQVAQSGQEIVANDVTLEPRFLDSDLLPGTRAEASLPLKIEERVVGVLDVQSDHPGAFQEVDMLVLGALAGNIAIAVEDSRLYTALRRRAEQLTTISEVSSAITSILNLDELLDQVVNLIQKRFGYSYVHLFTVHPGRRKIIFQAGTDPRRQIFREEGFSFDLDDPQGIIPWVARHANTLLVNDVSQEPRYRPSDLPPENTCSELAVPLVYGNEILGVIDIQSDRLNEFNEEDRFLFEALADTIAVALRNAFLYRTEKWRRQVADSLHEVAGLLSADVDLDHVLDAILAELERNLPCDVAVIWLLDEFENPDGTPRESPHLRLGAVLGLDHNPFELSRGVHLEDLVEKIQQNQPLSKEQDLTSWLIQSLDSTTPLIRSAESPCELLGRVLNFPPDYSAIAAPLRVGEQALGVLALGHHTAGRYGSEAQAMTATFASYASVAIENTRLYEAAHEQAWVSTVLLQVSEASQNLSNLNELLSTIVRITPMLIGVRSCALYMWDELEEAFLPAAYEGLTSEQKNEFEHWRFAPGDSPVLDRLRQEKKPIILHGLEDDPNLDGVLFDNRGPAMLPGVELLVLVPMISRGEVSGTFLVDYSNDLGNGNHSEILIRQFDERLAIIQGIAHQTAVAVENIRLQKAQREEAYVSVALLQVAQAVTSLTELDDILSSIVRITPILVGVRRSMVFLWQEGDASFLLAESYGLPRSANGRVYLLGEFDLLDSALQLLSPVAFPASSPELLSPELAGIEPPDLWAQIVLDDASVVDEYFESDLRLLIAFPLIARGEILGVMLVEEPEVDSMGGREGGRALRSLRKKRLEIITGITQQAALAIYNDRLQLQTVEQGRLERELQLARDIQRTFLPEQLPALPGWDLAALWRTAREVGGDFYDVFELPGMRLGLVIADAADKGLPAALYMTLVRTLVRATVREFDSPGAVLGRVNEILTPDTREGMFVTIFYAVLSAEDGRLVYANAGHNPPLLLRSNTLQIERLIRTGMAVGVEMENPILEYQIVLKPGDTLVCYTDGVTEAFSPDGEMYSETRLQTTLQAEVDWVAEPGEGPGFTTAQETLEAIDESVGIFSGDVPAQDDMTLMVVKRLYPTRD